MIREDVQRLLDIPKLEQKSEAWYEQRMNMITASDFAQALEQGKFGTQRQLIIKKCSQRENETVISTTNPFFKWGNTFEPVAIAIYEKLHAKKIYEFGLLKHPNIPFFGASPDGITGDGVMVEIKCPLKRTLTGEVPTQYYYQIQGQLDVCNLDICDYFECKFEMCEDLEKWKKCDLIKGCYREVDAKTTEYQEPFMMAEDISSVWLGSNCKYWVLKQYNIIRVTRDKVFLKDKFAELEKVWNQIVHYRKNQEAFVLDVLKEIEITTEKFEKRKWSDTYAFRDEPI